jgi:hypothetical protein
VKHLLVTNTVNHFLDFIRVLSPWIFSLIGVLLMCLSALWRFFNLWRLFNQRKIEKEMGIIDRKLKAGHTESLTASELLKAYELLKLSDSELLKAIENIERDRVSSGVKTVYRWIGNVADEESRP